MSKKLKISTDCGYVVLDSSVKEPVKLSEEKIYASLSTAKAVRTKTIKSFPAFKLSKRLYIAQVWLVPSAINVEI